MRRLLLLTAALMVTLAGPVNGGELHVMAWNVENLFDTTDDPEVEGDEEFTPAGPKKWDQQRLKTKLERLAGVIKKVNGGKGPDLLAVCEVENRKALELLVWELATLGRDYRIVHRDSPSDRGIDAAILYDARALRLRSSAFHHVEADDTRDIVEAEFEASGGARLRIFANHWPSRGNPEAQRIEAARTLRKRLDVLLAEAAAADVLILGDLNDHPDDPSVRQHLKTTADAAQAVGDTFFNATAAIGQDPSRGTYVYQNKWGVIDHIIASPGLLDAQGLRLKAGSAQEVRFPEQIFTPGNPTQIPRPNRTFTGDNYHATGISDHLPVHCVLEF